MSIDTSIIQPVIEHEKQWLGCKLIYMYVLVIFLQVIYNIKMQYRNFDFPHKACYIKEVCLTTCAVYGADVIPSRTQALTFWLSFCYFDFFYICVYTVIICIVIISLLKVLFWLEYFQFMLHKSKNDSPNQTKLISK